MTVLTGRPLSWAITATAGCGFLLYVYNHFGIHAQIANAVTD